MRSCASGCAIIINDESDLRVVSETGSCADALRQATTTQPHVIVLDLRLPDGSGETVIGDLKRATAQARVLILTSFADDSLLLAALKAGADGYLLKDVAEADLIGSIRRVANAAAVAPRPSPAQQSPSSSTVAPLERLTGQERRVFELVGRGHSNKEVAEATGLSEKTVRNYLGRVFEKLHVTSRSQIVALYLTDRPWRK